MGSTGNADHIDHGLPNRSGSDQFSGYVAADNAVNTEAATIPSGFDIDVG